MKSVLTKIKSCIKRSKLKKISSFLVLTLIVLAFSLLPQAASAGYLENKIILGVANIIYAIVTFLGKLAVYLIGWIVQVASWNHFIDVDTVMNGWTIVRDLSNMFFILILLIIAFATILRLESYSWKKMLPKLLLMAVLINFSKTISGLIIDFSQVIMLTFVSSFSGAGANNFVKLLGIDNLLTFAKDKDDAGVDLALNTIWGLLVALIFSIITLIVMAALLAILVMRVMMLWVYVILSPLAFLLSAFPQGQKYASQWWSEFSKNVITGPVLAFFLWLALSTAQVSSSKMSISTTGAALSGGIMSGLLENGVFQTYIITIGLLIGGLIVTQQAGGMAAGIAGKGMGWIRKGGAVLGGVAAAGALLPYKGGKKLFGFGVDKASERLGVDLNVARGYKRVVKQMEENKRSREGRIYKKAVETADQGGFIRSKAALLSTGDLAWQNFSSFQGSKYKRFLMGGKWANQFHGKAETAATERKKIWSGKEHSQATTALHALRGQEHDLSTKWSEQKLAVATAPKDRLKEEEDKLNLIETQRNQTREQIKLKEKDLRTTKVDDKKANELDGEIKTNKELDAKYRLKDEAVVTSAASADLERQEQPKITHLENADQLGKILKEAISEGNEGLIAATSKKMTKMSDYNEMMSQLGFGTGRQGMQQLAKHFEQQGRMSRQASLGLIAEIGGIAKNGNHFGAYGAAVMDNGRWRESTQDEMDSAQLAEMLKNQPQAFARNVNRLGLGYYNSPQQKVENWKPSRAALAYLKLNAEPMAEQYKSTGQQNAVEHLASQIELLRRNGISANLIATIENRTKVAKGQGVDVGAQVRSINV